MQYRILPICYLRPKPDPRSSAEAEAIVIFDGQCHLCNRVVRFLLRRDRRRYFKFSSRQSRFARRRLADLGLADRDTAVLLEQGRVFTGSTAALRILGRLGGMYWLAYGLILVPRPIRDAVYDWVSRNRHRWFGGRRCPVPVPAARNSRGRFIHR